MFDPHKYTSINPIAGMIPWACSYDGPGGHRFAITLYGSDEHQVLEDNCVELPNLRIDGRLVATLGSA